LETFPIEVHALSSWGWRMTFVKCSNYLSFVVVVDCLPLAMFEMLDMILSSSGIYFVMENFVFASLGLIPKILDACSLLALPT
jgi:hypothetical protein